MYKQKSIPISPDEKRIVFERFQSTNPKIYTDFRIPYNPKSKKAMFLKEIE